MEIKQLQTFQKAAELLNFTKTAEQLNFAQSSVTAHIKALEDELGIPLFDRMGKRLQLTVAGKKLLQYANRILSLVDEAHKMIHVQGEPEGELVIGASESLCTYRLPPVLLLFRQRYPKVRFHFVPGMSDQSLVEQVTKGALDAAVLMDEGEETDLLHVVPLQREPIVLAAAADHPLAKFDQIGPQDLYKEPLLLTEKNCCYRRGLDRALAERQLIPEQISEFASIEAIKQCVIAGIGAALLPQMTIRKELEDGLICILPWIDDSIQIFSKLVWRKDKWVSPALHAFLQMTQKLLGTFEEEESR
ncbi:LysR family transcriptional regulator [Sporolactobacillus sp. CPB3-1]|uniref:LysR family transcriptional regulator n=1 Tax=Sporolactobacillus mangiferae TaxID=2940498 RepID=A0ABT0M689_9BACL|nr:LysR family transcriptional regulator [Sporolactobacillus mangiferae]MCL1630354.1 LysR family transcriptional regulator [Sporolactobacillus mangiferae]